MNKPYLEIFLLLFIRYVVSSNCLFAAAISGQFWVFKHEVIVPTFLMGRGIESRIPRTSQLWSIRAWNPHIWRLKLHGVSELFFFNLSPARSETNEHLPPQPSHPFCFFYCYLLSVVTLWNTVPRYAFGLVTLSIKSNSVPMLLYPCAILIHFAYF